MADHCSHMPLNKEMLHDAFRRAGFQAEAVPIRKNFTLAHWACASRAVLQPEGNANALQTLDLDSCRLHLRVRAIWTTAWVMLLSLTLCQARAPASSAGRSSPMPSLCGESGESGISSRKGHAATQEKWLCHAKRARMSLCHYESHQFVQEFPRKQHRSALMPLKLVREWEANPLAPSVWPPGSSSRAVASLSRASRGPKPSQADTLWAGPVPLMGIHETQGTTTSHHEAFT